MKIFRFVIISGYMFLLSTCRQVPDADTLLKTIKNDFAGCNFREMAVFTDSLRKIHPDQKKFIHEADSLLEIAKRIEIDFSIPEDRFISQLKDKVGEFTPDDIKSWEEKNWIDMRTINGERRYFKRAASNLRLIRNFNLQRAYYDSLNSKSQESIKRHANISSIIKASAGSPVPVEPVLLNVEYTLTVDPDAVPDGETIRCWLPYPREDQQRQTDIKFISASPGKYVIAPDSATHKTVYMEAKAVKGIPSIFRLSFSYKSSGQYFDPDKIRILPYDINSGLYKTYISEQLPDICFTDTVHHLADLITGTETRPLEILRKLYYWVDSNIPWAGALEYSTIPNIPEYVIKNRRGDCGMQTFLLMSMLRYKGIPVRWQSGWMMPPGNENLHDWCEVYFEGTGWIPVDMSYGLQYSENNKVKDFYISGIDSYRLIVNDGVGGALYPEKKFLRSDPFDFQRGEVEWSGGNIYFDRWDYNIKIEYLPVKTVLSPKLQHQLTE